MNKAAITFLSLMIITLTANAKTTVTVAERTRTLSVSVERVSSCVTSSKEILLPLSPYPDGQNSYNTYESSFSYVEKSVIQNYLVRVEKSKSLFAKEKSTETFIDGTLSSPIAKSEIKKRSHQNEDANTSYHECVQDLADFVK